MTQLIPGGTYHLIPNRYRGEKTRLPPVRVEQIEGAFARVTVLAPGDGHREGDTLYALPVRLIPPSELENARQEVRDVAAAKAYDAAHTLSKEDYDLAVDLLSSMAKVRVCSAASCAGGPTLLTCEVRQETGRFESGWTAALAALCADPAETAPLLFGKCGTENLVVALAKALYAKRPADCFRAMGPDKFFWRIDAGGSVRRRLAGWQVQTPAGVLGSAGAVAAAREKRDAALEAVRIAEAELAGAEAAFYVAHHGEPAKPE